MEPIVLSEFQKNQLEDIKISLTEYQGHKLIDFRAYYRTDHGESKPTKKGISVNVKFFPELKEAILKAEEILTEKELL